MIVYRGSELCGSTGRNAGSSARSLRRALTPSMNILIPAPMHDGQVPAASASRQ
jgi:hypothetical protein